MSVQSSANHCQSRRGSIMLHDTITCKNDVDSPHSLDKGKNCSRTSSSTSIHPSERTHLKVIRDPGTERGPSGPVKSRLIRGIDPASVPYPAAFVLSPSSAFSRAKMSSKEWKLLSPQIKAKYLAYETPSAEIQQKVVVSHIRSMIRVREDKAVDRKSRREMEERQLRALEAAQVAQGAGSKDAAERMRQRFNAVMEFRESELQFLVDGQRSSIEALLLKEHLMMRPCLCHNKVEKELMTEKDIMRLKKLLPAK